MSTNKAGLDLIKEFEGFYANFYKCPAGIKTIGYGHACHVNDCSKIKAPLSKDAATKLLAQDLKKYESCVKCPKCNENQFSALVSFTYNCGCGALSKSGMLDLVAKGKTSQVQAVLNKYTKGGGKQLPGLVRRRKAEWKLFNTPVSKK